MVPLEAAAIDEMFWYILDGVFTATLRGILSNVRGEMDYQHWIILDGDVGESVY